MKTGEVILIMFGIALAIGIMIMLFVFRDYEHKKKKCGNCAIRDEQMKYCWPRDFHVGTETKGCWLFVNKNKSSDQPQTLSQNDHEL